MTNPTFTSTQEALKLRAQALEMLRRAQQLDGLKAYGLPSYAPVTSPVFILWSVRKPDEDIAGGVYRARENEMDSAVKPIKLEDLCGVSTSSRLDGNETA